MAVEVAQRLETVVTADGRVLAHVIHDSQDISQTEFPTPSDSPMQVGFVVYPANSEIVPHIHRPLERHYLGTPEVLVVQHGKALADLYDEDKTLVKSVPLGQGDIIILVSGGHGFRLLEDTKFLEVKAGPYRGVQDMDRFEPGHSHPHPHPHA